jgi:hypothetical protein
MLLKEVKFEPTMGDLGHLRLTFGSQTGKDFSQIELKQLRDNLRSAAKIIRYSDWISSDTSTDGLENEI